MGDWIVELGAAGTSCQEVGGKAFNLGYFSKDYAVPPGFVLSARAFDLFLEHNNLQRMLAFELQKLPMTNRRWEELWDCALRIRNLFLKAEIPPALLSAVRGRLLTGGLYAVRSSAIEEDQAEHSFAGMHDSYIELSGDEVPRAIQKVWASLWSDRAILYRVKKGLPLQANQMAVIVQSWQSGELSGVAFGRDPSGRQSGNILIEVIAGRCKELVDGETEPEKLWLASNGDSNESQDSLLTPAQQQWVKGVLARAEELFQRPADIEFTMSGQEHVLLQARPMSSGAGLSANDAWYLQLTPSQQAMERLAHKVVHELLPALKKDIATITAQSDSDAIDLEAAFDACKDLVQLWHQRYKEFFIPFAHGVRQLGVYYNDLVGPEDPYEFVGLLTGTDLLAMQRHKALAQLAASMAETPGLLEQLRQQPQPSLEALSHSQPAFAKAFRQLLSEHFAIHYHGERFLDHPDSLLANLIELANNPVVGKAQEANHAEALEAKLMAAAGPQGQAQAKSMLALGRQSWRYRDDDNLYIGQLEDELLRVANLVPHRKPELPPSLAQAAPPSLVTKAEGWRQRSGQPSAVGVARGRVRRLESFADASSCKKGDIIVVQAIQPNMTHVVALAAAIVECRGGMLIHGAIIAREFGIPCVNGIYDALSWLQEGDEVIVDGYLGVVTKVSASQVKA